MQKKENFLGHNLIMGKQRIYFIFYPFSLTWIHIYRIFCFKLLHFYFLYEVLVFMKHQYCHCANCRLMPLCALYNQLLTIVSISLKFISKVATVVWEYLEVVQQSGQADCCFWARGSKMVFRFLTITRDNTAPPPPATTLVSSVQCAAPLADTTV